MLPSPPRQQPRGQPHARLPGIVPAARAHATPLGTHVGAEGRGSRVAPASGAALRLRAVSANRTRRRGARPSRQLQVVVDCGDSVQLHATCGAGSLSPGYAPPPCSPTGGVEHDWPNVSVGRPAPSPAVSLSPPQPAKKKPRQHAPPAVPTYTGRVSTGLSTTYYPVLSPVASAASARSTVPAASTTIRVTALDDVASPSPTHVTMPAVAGSARDSPRGQNWAGGATPRHPTKFATVSVFARGATDSASPRPSTQGGRRSPRSRLACDGASSLATQPQVFTFAPRVSPMHVRRPQTPGASFSRGRGTPSPRVLGRVAHSPLSQHGGRHGVSPLHRAACIGAASPQDQRQGVPSDAYAARWASDVEVARAHARRAGQVSQTPVRKAWSELELGGELRQP